MSYTLGKDCKAYYNATALTAVVDQTAVSAGVLISNITNLKINISGDKADVTTRASGKFKQYVSTYKDASITFSSVWKTTDTAFAAIKTAWNTNAEIAFYALTGDKAVAGSEGLCGNFTVSKFDRDESLSEAVKVDIELSPSSFNDWFTTTGS